MAGNGSMNSVACFKDDPLAFARLMWPSTTFYREQKMILESVVSNDETFVPAGNMLGKDFVSGFIALWFFLTRTPCRVITTSVKDDHLRVLWGEIGRFVQDARYPLTDREGGPLVLRHRDVRKVVFKEDVEREAGGRRDPKVDRFKRRFMKSLCQISYLRGMVSEHGEGLAGHHAAHTLCIIDEASGVDEVVYTQQATWARRLLVIGNPNECNNFFKKGVKEGDLAKR